MRSLSIRVPRLTYSIYTVIARYRSPTRRAWIWFIVIARTIINHYHLSQKREFLCTEDDQEMNIKDAESICRLNQLPCDRLLHLYSNSSFNSCIKLANSSLFILEVSTIITAPPHV